MRRFTDYYVLWICWIGNKLHVCFRNPNRKLFRVASATAGYRFSCDIAICIYTFFEFMWVFVFNRWCITGSQHRCALVCLYLTMPTSIVFWNKTGFLEICAYSGVDILYCSEVYVPFILGLKVFSVVSVYVGMKNKIQCSRDTSLRFRFRLFIDILQQNLENFIKILADFKLSIIIEYWWFKNRKKFKLKYWK